MHTSHFTTFFGKGGAGDAPPKTPLLPIFRDYAAAQQYQVGQQLGVYFGDGDTLLFTGGSKRALQDEKVPEKGLTVNFCQVRNMMNIFLPEKFNEYHFPL